MAGCKPIDKRGPLESRQAVWDAIRRMRRFTVPVVRDETLLKTDTVRDYILGLEAAGYVRKITESSGVGVPARWELAKDAGSEAPRVRRDGTPVIQGLGRENMWNAMRILRDFTPRELAVAASMPTCRVKELTAEDYIKHLHRAGYLRKNGSRYMFLPGAYTGPMAPMIQRTKRVWDPNLKQIRWSSYIEPGEASHDE